jgi:hypothetical protein
MTNDIIIFTKSNIVQLLNNYPYLVVEMIDIIR